MNTTDLTENIPLCDSCGQEMDAPDPDARFPNWHCRNCIEADNQSMGQSRFSSVINFPEESEAD